MQNTGKDYNPELIGKHQNPELWVRGGAIVDKSLSVKQLYIDVKSSMSTLTGQQSGTDAFVFATGTPDVTTLYYTTGDNLYRYNHADRSTEFVGNMSGVVFFDIAISPSGALFGVSDTGFLYSVDTPTLALTQIGSVDGLNALTFDANGVLYSVDGTSLVSINTSTAVKTSVGDLGAFSMGDIVFFNDVLFLAATDGSLIKYPSLDDLSDRVVVGSFSPFQIYGLAQLKINDTTKLIGLTADFRVCDINHETAVCTNIRQFNANNEQEQFIAGATSQCWGRPLSKVAFLYPTIKVSDDTVASIVVHLLGRDMVTNDVYTSSRTIRVKNLEEFYVHTLETYSVFGEGTLPSNLVALNYLADQSSFLIQVVTPSPNTVTWTATIIKTTD